MRFRFWKKPKPAAEPKKPAANGGASEYVRGLKRETGKRPLTHTEQLAQIARLEARRAQAAKEKAEQGKHLAAAEAKQKAEMVRQGGNILEFVKACSARKLNPDQAFEQLYAKFSRIRGFIDLEAMAEVGSQIEGIKFSEAQFWADVMLANNLQVGGKLKVPKKYLRFVERKKKK